MKIQIFRKKRKALLFTKRIKKYLLYSLGEITLVVLGILIALYISNWDENNKIKNESNKSLERIKTDLETEAYVLKDFKKRYNYSKNYLKKILYQGDTNNIDSIRFHFGPFVHYRMNTEYLNLKSSGQLNLISNRGLRNNIVNFYEVYYSIYSELEKEHKLFINSRVLDYFYEEFPSDTTNFIKPKLVLNKLSDYKFKAIINNQIISLDYITKNLFLDQIDNIIRKIDLELE
ncbi:MAG: DUF6090 family protein [Roseovarius sp.]